MYKTFKALIVIVWVMDILNFSQVELLDTTYPVDFLAWLLIFLFLPDTTTRIKHVLSLPKQDN